MNHESLAHKFMYSAATVLFLLMLLSSPGTAQNAYTVIHDFTGADGLYPWGDLISDASGNLYGEMALGDLAECGELGCGNVFELSGSAGGGWKRTILHSFAAAEGWEPSGGLVFDAKGNLYGVTIYGGSHNRGVAFELSPGANGVWTETVLHSFGGAGDSSGPWGRPVLDASGNLYGTTSSGGLTGAGAVWELSPHSNETWSETILYGFTGGSDGGSPYTALIFDTAGNLYGTTSAGGDKTVYICGLNGGCGVAFKLSKNASGLWSETVIHTFDGADGWFSEGFISDDAGNLYSVTGDGGNFTGCGGFGCGVVYELSPNGNSGWAETLLHVFQPGSLGYGGPGGSSPVGITFDSGGNLYGSTFYGGNYESDCGLALTGCGVIFKLSRNSSGAWAETIVHAFTGGADGGTPQSNVIFDIDGNLLGTGTSGPAYNTCITAGGCGVAFEIKP